MSLHASLKYVRPWQSHDPSHMLLDVEVPRDEFLPEFWQAFDLTCTKVFQAILPQCSQCSRSFGILFLW